ncbi:MAG: FAD-dependent oxidoreductase [Nocardiaceae bacterium]|nr:FAD-dependent oxidoreductase [Nocardiaceae bacterium]
MPHVVTQPCCSDASCVFACPVNVIHPTPDEPDFLTAEQVYIDPESCVDCGACVDACPVDAIVPHTKLTEKNIEFLEINAEFYRNQPDRPRPILAIPPVSPKADDSNTLRVAIVGSGPAAMYAADELLKQKRVRVDVYEKLDSPYGLVRHGVAPDHQSTKRVSRLFDKIAAEKGFRFHLGVEVGKDITHAELATTHHAVIYAVGASSDRKLGIPGEDLPGSIAATEFVAWYNDHPDFRDRSFDLSTERVVIAGNGNVALDVARILTANPDDLADTTIAPHALAALRESKVREVVILGRRGPAQAAYTLPELMGLVRKHSARIVVDGKDLVLDSATKRARKDGKLAPGLLKKLELAEEISAEIPTVDDARRRIILRYLASPTEIHGEDRVETVTVTRNKLTVKDGTVKAVATDESETIETGLVLRSVGYHGEPVAGLPFDYNRGVIPNDEGRVLRGETAVSGQYVVGWIKRGPSGFIGTNKSCSKETVDNLIADFNAGRLPAPSRLKRRNLLAV